MIDYNIIIYRATGRDFIISFLGKKYYIKYQKCLLNNITIVYSFNNNKILNGRTYNSEVYKYSEAKNHFIPWFIQSLNLNFKITTKLTWRNNKKHFVNTKT